MGKLTCPTASRTSNFMMFSRFFDNLCLDDAKTQKWKRFDLGEVATGFFKAQCVREFTLDNNMVTDD